MTNTTQSEQVARSLQLEKSILYLVWTSQSARQILSQIKPEWFLSGLGVRVLKITQDCLDENLPLDTVLAQNKLEYQDFEDIFLIDNPPGLYSLPAYIKLMAENYVKCRVELLSKELSNNFNLETFEKIRSVILENQQSNMVPVKLSNVAHDVVSKMASTTKRPGFYSGFQTLDECLLGFRPGEVYTIGGRPGEGKTSFVCQLALNMAKESTKVLIVSIEMKSDDLTAYKILPAFMGLSVVDFRTGDIKKSMPIITEKFEHMEKKQIFLFHHPAPTLDDVRIAINKCKADIVLIDYLQIIRPPRAENRRMEIVRIMTDLPRIALEYQVPIILLAQLNRETDKRIGSPVMADLLESSAIEAASDVVMLMWEPRPTKEEEMKKQNALPYKPIRVKIAKNRHGLRKNFVLELDKRTTEIKQSITALGFGSENETELGGIEL